MASSKIVDLASIIMSNVIEFDDGLKVHHLPSPSFDTSTYVNLPPSAELERTQIAILDAISELQALMLGPSGMLRNTALAYIDLISIQAIYSFGIAQFVSDGTTYPQISQQCGLDEQSLRRIMRHAMTNHIFKEKNNLVTHTAASKVLSENPLMQSWIGMICEESWPAAARTVEALRNWPASQEPEHTGFALAKNIDISFFAELSRHPTRAKRFADAMAMFESGHGSAISSLLEHYPWGDLGRGTIIDVGGSYGSRSIAIAKRFPSLSCVVLDLPEVVADGPPKLPSELKSRVAFAAHDFFTTPPKIVMGADLFLFCRVFHNWSDKYSIQILRCLIPALKFGARILINEICLPEAETVPNFVERKMRASDLGMMAMLNAKERGYDDWVKLFQAADERYQLIEVARPPKSQVSLVRAIWKGYNLNPCLREEIQFIR